MSEEASYVTGAHHIERLTYDLYQRLLRPGPGDPQQLLDLRERLLYRVQILALMGGEVVHHHLPLP